MSNVPLPEPDVSWQDGQDQYGYVTYDNAYSAEAMHAYAAAVSAAKDADIAQLRAELVSTNERWERSHQTALAIQDERDALWERVKVLEDALAGVLAFQSAPTQPTIHDWGRWRRILHARAALESAK